MVDISQYVTSMTSPVYGLVNLPEQVKGGVIVRLSRTKSTARKLLATEFAKELPEFKSLPELKKSSDLFQRVFVQYGDASGAETVIGHFIVEGCSIKAEKFLEDRRFASFIAQSSRYVQLGKDDQGLYPYVIPIDLNSNQQLLYTQAMDELFQAYEQIGELVYKHLIEYSVKPDEVDQDVWENANRLKALDVARGLLPLATKTNVGIVSNMLTIERMVNHCFACDNQELLDFGRLLYDAATAVAPALLRRVNHSYGEAAREAIVDRRLRNLERWDEYQTHYKDRDKGRIYVEMVDVEHGHSLTSILQFIEDDEQDPLRQNRHDPLPRFTEFSSVHYEIQCTIAAWRDLQRHRLPSREEHPFTNRLGYNIPSLVIAAGCDALWQKAADQAHALFSVLESELDPDVASYVLPLCSLMRWQTKMNLRELCHLVELRTTPAAHDEYKKIAIDMYQKACIAASDDKNWDVEDILNDIKFVGAEDEGHLPRLQEETRLKKRGRVD